MNNLEARLEKCFTAVFPELQGDRIASASMESLPEWDSIAHVTLIEVIQQDFGILVEDDELDRLTSYRAWVARLRN